MNDHKIAFIVCTNNQVMMNECTTYINGLKVPEGYATDVITITDAKSICSGYNQAMNKCDAKYKIYLHQDIFITDENFILKLLDIFASDEKIGMIGLIGAPHLDKNAIMWEMPRVGNLMTDRIDHMDLGVHPGEIIDADCVDGILMATQYDIPWRDDLFKGFHFYDISQSFEYRRKGYRVVVQDTDNDLVIHDAGVPGMFDWERDRQICLKEYKDMLGEDDFRKEHGLDSGEGFWIHLHENKEEYLERIQKALDIIDEAIRYKEVNGYALFCSYFKKYINYVRWSGTVVKLYQMTQIVFQERGSGSVSTFFLDDVNSVREALDKYQFCRQLMMRLFISDSTVNKEKTQDYLKNHLSGVAFDILYDEIKGELNKWKTGK